jgi:hypothetical protein
MDENLIFDHKAFQNVYLTKGYNLSDIPDDDVLKMFKSENVPGRNVMLVKTETGVQVLEPAELGTNPNIDKTDAENAVPIRIPRFPFANHVTATDVAQAMTMRDGKLKMIALAEVVQGKMGRHRDNHRATRIFSCYGALHGNVKAKSDTSLANLHAIMGVTKRSVELPLDVDDANIPSLLGGLVKETKRLAKKRKLRMKGVTCRWGVDNITKLLEHPKVKEFYGEHKYPAIIGTWYENYERIKICGIDFIADDSDEVEELGATWPGGAEREIFAMAKAPPDVLGASSSANRECYITTEKMPHKAGLEIESRALVLPFCRDPALLCELKVKAPVAA